MDFGPSGGADYSAPVADLTKELKIAVEETTKGSLGGVLAVPEFFESLGYYDDSTVNPFAAVLYFPATFTSIPTFASKYAVVLNTPFPTPPAPQPTHIVVNGNEHPATITPGRRRRWLSSTSAFTTAGLFPTASFQEFGIDIKYSDGSFATNIRPSQAVKSQKIMNQREANAWIDARSPKRVTTLPDESSGKEGDRVWLESDYSVTNGVNITPQDFAGTELDTTTDPDAAPNIGNRGWYSKADAGFQFGEIHPSLPDNFVLISERRIYVKRNTLTNLSKIYIGETSYALTRTAQPAGSKLNNNPAYASSLPDVDYYTVGGLPSGDWDNVRFETTTAGTFIPASTTITKGLYEFKNNDWSRAGFYAPAAQPDKNLTFQVEEKRPGNRQDQNIALTSSGFTYTKSNPFSSSPDILRLTYNSDPSDRDTFERYTVFISLDNFQDSDAPVLLKLGSTNYSLSYFETDAGQAVYRSQVVANADQINSPRTITGVNIQRADNSWVGQTGEKNSP